MDKEQFDSLVAGAIFDFAAFLTTREKKLVISSKHNSAPVADAVVEFLTLRGVNDKNPMVKDWEHLR